MSLHDLIVKEFERTKSLSALIYLINMGEKSNFYLKETDISCLAAILKKESLFGVARVKKNKVLILQRN